jgi:hypothetical protein
MLKPVPNLKQFNISLDPKIKSKLEEFAVEFKMEKATKVGAKIIERYYEQWAVIQGISSNGKMNKRETCSNG